MSFIIDKQTLKDLNILGKGKQSTVYGLFNRTRTRGGALVLEEMFRYPLSDDREINRRSETIRYFMEHQISFDFPNEWFDTIEHYLSNTDERSRLLPENDNLQRKLKGAVGADAEYELLHKGVVASIALLNNTCDMLAKLEEETPFQEERTWMEDIVRNPLFGWVKAEEKTKRLPYAKMTQYDSCLRFDGNQQLHRLLELLYTIDVYIALGDVAKEHGFVFGKALPKGDNHLVYEGIYHPLLTKPIANTLHVDRKHNVIFLTGANMAGKSTFMKTFGIVTFLAHMGFPLPAAKVEFTVQNGMYTTINLADNIDMGYSHFFAEVQRVKEVATQVARTENLVVVFDELFRGTNVKDAYDATSLIVSAFAEKRNCTFLFSTHIMEVGDELRRQCDNVNFVYLPTIMAGNVPRYTYQLREGITSDRHGMMIINNKHILDILKKHSKQ